MRLSLLFVSLLLLTPVLALVTDKQEYYKGDTLVINDLMINDSLIIRQGSAVILHSGGVTSLNYSVSNLDPSGDWLIINGFNNKSVVVNPTRNSTRYLITFISPLSRDYERTEGYYIRVNVTDEGAPVVNASVNAFNSAGERVSLVEEGGGVYSINDSVSVNSSLGNKTIIVVASKGGYGGENKLNITIIPATIIINLLEPKLLRQGVGDELLIKVKASYPDGSKPSSVEALFNNRLINLSLSGDYFVGKYIIQPVDNGLGTLIIKSVDESGNEGVITKKITVNGLLTYYLRVNIYYILIGALLIGVLFFVTQRKVSGRIEFKKLKEKRKELIADKKKLQKEYFVTGEISKSVYEDKANEIDEQLNIIKDKLDEYKKKR